MSLLAFGLNHRRAPISVLEKAALDEVSLDRILSAAEASPDISEHLVVATCNRTEIYAEVSGFHGAVADLTDAMTTSTGITHDDLKEHLDLHYGDAAVAHVFNVAAGLDSMAVGESQILGQLRDALARGQAGGHVGPSINSLVQQALRTGKQVHSETGIDEVSRSLVGVGLDAAEQHVGPLAQAHVLVVGAGAMSALAATSSVRRGVERLTVVNRTHERGLALAERLEGTARPLDELAEALADADIVISCTGSTGLAISLAEVADAQVSRGGRRQAYIDLALPHDIAHEVAGLTGVVRLGLAELGGLLGSGGAVPEVEQARSLVGDAVTKHLGARAAHEAAPTVRALRAAAQQVVERELARLDQRAPDMTPEHRTEVDRAVHRIVDKLLHQPTVRAKELAVDGRLGEYQDALRQLFDLHSDGGAL
ncbi:glutamyl-tRNA reductase [Janibacter sp. CX7]|jgi:glutamyl-tRNA reductase|uniref:glutamyl-tRNA reductase n=1 Tax=Janibacter sp. CX7 TaxID=2963431 RepID=UPI0020CF9D7C|nr:glutamyl-tRNA reductase [Janibacter sp. CX7]UTT65526.1 glutamyl-tRNA reductase [Janibacter sp. CX7]